MAKQTYRALRRKTIRQARTIRALELRIQASDEGDRRVIMALQNRVAYWQSVAQGKAYPLVA